MIAILPVSGASTAARPRHRRRIQRQRRRRLPQTPGLSTGYPAPPMPSPAPSDDALLQWMSDLEDRFRYVVYLDDPRAPAWALPAASDHVDRRGPDADPSPAPSSASSVRQNASTRRSSSASPPGSADRSCIPPAGSPADPSRHHHVRVAQTTITPGWSLHLGPRGWPALSGGGARLAHVGVSSAPRPACQSTPSAVRASDRRRAVRCRPAPEAIAECLRHEHQPSRLRPALPIVALSSAGSVRMKRLFGDVDVGSPDQLLLHVQNLSRAQWSSRRGPLGRWCAPVRRARLLP